MMLVSCLNLMVEVSMHKCLSILRTRLPVLAAFAAVAITLLVGIHLRGDLSGAWQMLDIPVPSPSFTDTRTITHAIDCLLSGQDPYTVRSFDPWHRLYNYPPVWLDLRYLGVTSRTTNLLGIILAIMTASAFLLLFRARTWISALVVFFATTSTAVLFAVQRGNNDQAIFFLLVVGLFLIDHTKINLRPALKSALIVILTILKIFPVVAVALLVRNRKGPLVALLTAALSIAALVITCGRRIPQVLANTPQDVFVSFGALPFFVGIFTHTSHQLLKMALHHPKAISLGALILAVLSVIAGLYFRKQLDYFLPPLDLDDSRGCIAAAGLAIFCVSFLRGSGFDYRLIFLLGAVACLVEDLNKRTSLRALPTAILFVLLLWKPDLLSPLFEVVDGLVFIVASAWLGTSLLDNLRLFRARPPAHSIAP